MQDMSKEARIKREVSALKKQYKLIDVAHKVNAERLIQRAAYQKATLEDLRRISMRTDGQSHSSSRRIWIRMTGRDRTLIYTSACRLNIQER